MDKSKIALLTTVANFELYNKTAPFFPDVQHYVFDGTNGMHGLHSINYMMQKLRNKRIDWLIMADEDVIFTDPNAVFTIIEQMERESITIAGVRDGGSIQHREKNPHVINTFFSIVNFQEITAIWNKKQMLQNQYVKENEFSDDLTDLIFQYDASSLYEPYYCFYLWLRRIGKKFLFLDTQMHSDGIANKVFYNKREILCHTWYARTYGNNEKHTKRIDAILEENEIVDLTNRNIVKPIFYKKTTFAIEQELLKNYRKICRKLGK